MGEAEMSVILDEIKRRYSVRTERLNRREGVYAAPAAWDRRKKALRKSAAGVALRRSA
jgi:hypothetical protein